MCLSPDEMSSERIEYRIEGLRRIIEAYPDAPRANYYKRRIELLEGILKERANAGTL